MDSGLDFSENIVFVDGAVEFTYLGSKYPIKRPSALESVKLSKDIKALKEDDMETMVKFYIDTLIKFKMPEAVANSLDMFSLGEVFRAINSPAAKKK